MNKIKSALKEKSKVFLKRFMRGNLASLIVQQCARQHFSRFLRDRAGCPKFTPPFSDLEIKICALTNWERYFAEIINLEITPPNEDKPSNIGARKTASWNSDIKAALKYSSLAIPGFFNSQSSKDIIDNIPAEVKGQSLLDIGSGTGILALKLAKMGFKVDATDVSPTQLAILNFLKVDLPITTYQCDAFHLNKIGKKYACCVSRWFMSHFPDQAALLASVGDCLEPGGYFVYDMDNSENLAMAQSQKYFDTRLTGYSRNENDSDFYKASSLKELWDIAEKNNFRLLKRVPVMFFHNNLFASCLQSDYALYAEKLCEFLKKDDVRDFMEFFSRRVTAHCPEWLTFRSIIVLRKM